MHREITETLLKLVSHDNGADLDVLYRIIEKHPGCFYFAADLSANALLVSMMHFIKCAAEYRRAGDARDREKMLDAVERATAQADRIASLASFIGRAGDAGLQRNRRFPRKSGGAPPQEGRGPPETRLPARPPSL